MNVRHIVARINTLQLLLKGFVFENDTRKSRPRGYDYVTDSIKPDGAHRSRINKQKNKQIRSYLKQMKLPLEQSTNTF